MKRFKVHLSVGDVEGSVRFFGAQFGRDPCVQEAEHARWTFDDPKSNFALSQFAISRIGEAPGEELVQIVLDPASEAA